WRSRRRAAWAPPPKIWISGTGSRPTPPRWCQSGCPAAAAAAHATAIDVATVALAPNPDRPGVPSSSMTAGSRAARSAPGPPEGGRPDQVVQGGEGRGDVDPPRPAPAVTAIETLARTRRRARRRDGPAPVRPGRDLNLNRRSTSGVPYSPTDDAA